MRGTVDWLAKRNGLLNHTAAFKFSGLSLIQPGESM
jgi:hypothetical protein